MQERQTEIAYAEAPVPVGLLEGAATPDGYGAALPWIGELLEAGTAGAGAGTLAGELLEAATAGTDGADDGLALTVTVE